MSVNHVKKILGLWDKGGASTLGRFHDSKMCLMSEIELIKMSSSLRLKQTCFQTGTPKILITQI